MYSRLIKWFHLDSDNKFNPLAKRELLYRIWDCLYNRFPFTYFHRNMQSIIPLVCKKLGISWVVFSDLIWRDANIPRWIRKTFCYRQYLSIYTWYQLIQVHNRMKAHILRQCKEALVGWLSTFHFCALEQVCKFNQNMWKTIFNYNRLKYSPWQ